MRLREPLGVWLHGERVADLTTRSQGSVHLRYAASAAERWAEGTPLLSCSLPLNRKYQDAGVFCSGLLPEGEQRKAVGELVGVSPFDTFALLERLGRDTAGALVISRDPPEARPGATEVYTEATLAAEVADLPKRPLALHEDSELTIAGAQDKVLLVELPDGRWGRPVAGHPSTHILKIEDRRFPGLAAAEAACHGIARALGLTGVDVELVEVAGQACLFIPRFDRVRPGGDRTAAIGRIHQEDACQALGKDPDSSRGRGKYESTGGPSFRAVAALLARYAREPDRELFRLVAAMTFTVVIGNADAHGKNLALLHPEPEVVELAPLYDTVPTMLWPTLRSEAAMAVNGQFSLRGVTAADLESEAVSWGLGPRRVHRMVSRTAQLIAEAAADVEPRLGAMITARAEALVRPG